MRKPTRYLQTQMRLTPADKTYVEVRVYKNIRELQKDYKKFSPQDEYHDIAGVHMPVTRLCLNKKTGEMEPDKERQGLVWLCYERCGAGIIAHEFGHAVMCHFRDQKTDRFKAEYQAFTIENMDEEELLLHNLFFTVSQFYDWLYQNESFFQQSNS